MGNGIQFTSSAKDQCSKNKSESGKYSLENKGELVQDGDKSVVKKVYQKVRVGGIHKKTKVNLSKMGI